ncbi:hypothetical protein RIF29_38354 [Crotalaria pallida]|uniref:Uncharacterized protein n=1 Tax=Crotalaria pallida TaxID=3830 RepID=A0AAN9E1K5_CROPI
MSPSPFAQPMYPSANGVSHSYAAWPQPNVLALHIPGSILQSSRLRSSLCAPDLLPEEFDVLPDFDGKQHLLNEFSSFSQPHLGAISLSRSVRSNTLTPSNLDELFSSEISSSPGYSDLAAASVFSPAHKTAVLNQFQQLQSTLSPIIINTNVLSPKNVDHPLLARNMESFGVLSPGRMSPRSMESISPMSFRYSAFAQHEIPQQQLWSLSSRDLGSNNPTSVVRSPVNSWSKWGSPNGQVDWLVNENELGRSQRSSSFVHESNGEEEPDLSWVQSFVKESPPETIKEKSAGSGHIPSADGPNTNPQIESVDHSVLGAWLEQMHLDQLVV